MSVVEPPPPQVVGGFRVLGPLGSGGMGSVFEGEEPNIERRVAIKILRARLADDPNFVARFQNEARLANSVNHPAIVDVFSFGRLDDGRPFFIMPLLQGESLRALLAREKKLAPSRAWSIARDVADALAAAHTAGLVHRDLKPDNVFLEKKGEHERVRVMDFGIAKSVAGSEGGSAPQTQTGMLLGTPAYMAPEQWWGAKLDAGVDQYALGVMLFEMLAGSPPFDPNHESGVMRLHLHEPPPELAGRGVHLSERVDALIRRLLAKEPKDRFASMADVIAAGNAAFALESPSVTAPTEMALLPTDLAPAPPPSEVEVTPLRNRWLVCHVACTGIAVAVMAGAGYAGPSRWNYVEWFRQSGWVAYPIAVSFLAAVMLLPVGVFARDGSRRFRPLLLALTLAPGILGTLGTYPNWEAVERTLSRVDASRRFEVFNAGGFEAGTLRFMAFGVATGLSLSLAALAALTPSGRGIVPDRAQRLETALAVAVVMCAVAAAFMGAPSALVVALPVAAFLITCSVLPIAPSRPSAEVERSVYAGFALFFASDSALERVAGRRSILWEGLDRAARIEEIMAADVENMATLAVVFFACMIVLAVQWSRLRDAPDVLKLFRRHLPLLLILVAVTGLDLFMAGKFRTLGRAQRELLASQFALFAELDPPSTQELPAAEFAPSGGAALQVAQTAVAVDGREVVRLNTITSTKGRTLVDDALREALARKSRAPLSCLVDRRVSWGELRELMAVAYEAGATDAELLFTRGGAPKIPKRGPPEVTWVTRSDFVAVRVSLSTHGVEPDRAKRFGELAAGLVAKARAGDTPVLVVPAGRDPGR